jgi:hypothetical protein
MIFRDRVNVTLKEKKFVAGTLEFVTVFDDLVPGIVTFMDSNVTFDPTGTGGVSSRLRIFLKPFSYQIPPNASSNVAFAWGPWENLTPDGAVELHYRNGRLDHYEVLAKAV